MWLSIQGFTNFTAERFVAKWQLFVKIPSLPLALEIAFLPP